MAFTLEKKVKKVVTAQLTSMGAYWFYPTTGGYGSSGVPDIIGCYRGYFFGIECKAGKGVPTALQLKNLKDIVTAGGYALLVNEKNMHAVRTLMEDTFLNRTDYGRGM